MAQQPGGLKLILYDAREHTLSRLEGLSEYDLRRPMTPTGTNLLGVVKHLSGIESHGGHLAITRELIDGRADDNDTTFATPAEWKSYVAKVQAAADHFA